MDSTAKEELQALEAIYGEDLTCETNAGTTIVRIALKADEDGPSWFSALLEFILTSQYPQELPAGVSLRHPRGLNETEIDTCVETARQQLDSKANLYDAIEGVRDYLTRRSGLSLPCPICLYGFVRDDSVTVTAECSHHFHTYCLAQYVEHSRREQEQERALFGRAMNREMKDSVYCPVCRTSIDSTAMSMPPCNLEPKSWMQCDPSKSDPHDWSSMSNPIERHHKELWERQKRNGGLIDLQREKERFLVTEHTRLPSSSIRSGTNSSIH